MPWVVLSNGCSGLQSTAASLGNATLDKGAYQLLEAPNCVRPLDGQLLTELLANNLVFLPRWSRSEIAEEDGQQDFLAPNPGRIYSGHL